MTEKLNLALFFGGKSGEHAVSLMSARSVLNALDNDKYNITQVGITQHGAWLTGDDVLGAFEAGEYGRLSEVLLSSKDGRPMLYTRKGTALHNVTRLDIAFPVLHGTFGEDGTIQGLFEMLDVAYVGAGVLASAVAMDKAVSKQLVASLGIPVLAWQVFTRTAIQADLESITSQAEKVSAYPLFVKPANLGSSVGIRKATNRAELSAALVFAARFDRRILVERGIPAREIEISLLGNETPTCSVPGEIVPGDEFYTYTDKYLHGDPEICIPAPLPEDTARSIQQQAIQAYQVVDGAGMARVDFLVDKDTGEAYFNEINTIPGFTNISMYAKLWLYSGLSYSQLIDRLIELAFDRKNEQDKTVRKFEGSHEQ